MTKSAKILPAAYSGASAALLYRDTTGITRVDKAVLVATAVLAFINFGPTDNARLASAKRAEKRCRLSSSASEISPARKMALKWRMLVRIKLVGQLLGLVYMAAAKTSTGIMQGAGIIMGTNAIFFMGGAGDANHNADGAAEPMPTNKSNGLLILDTVLMVAAIVAASAAASSPIVNSSLYIPSALFYSGGAAIGGLEGLVLSIARIASKDENK